MEHLISPLGRVGNCPNHNDGLDIRTNRCTLRDDKDPGARLSLVKAVPEMSRHRAAIVSDEDTVLAGRDFEHVRIGKPDETTVGGGSKIDRRFASLYRHNDVVVEICVSLEANQGRDSPILARARWIFSQSAGLASDKGILLASNSRSVSSRYLSISAW